MVSSMEVIETIIYNDNTYCVKGNRIVVDDSFSHEYGIERGYHYEVEDLEIYEAFDECGEDIKYSNSDEALIYKLTKILEDKFNES